jgi:rod shape-determining protein MreD
VTGLLNLAAARACVMLGAALAAVTVGTRTQVPLPDLVLPVVAAGALLSGPSRGALLGLAAGWLVDLMPPAAGLLGQGALLYAACGLLAGAGRREGTTSWGWIALVSAAAAAVVHAGRIVCAGLAGTPVAWADTGVRCALTAGLAVVAVPVLVELERRLRRRSRA